ncbi:MAG: glycosyltransferase [Chloroflexi bacterium]|nr:glycosyltransferase [Chloroflexota bacterium]
MSKMNKYRAARTLDAISNPQDLSYKVPGLLTWLLVIVAIVGLWAFPRPVLYGARVVAFYTLIRYVIIVFFYLVGLIRVRRWETRVKLGADPGTPPHGALRYDDIHHVVFVCNYKEPAEILTRTLTALAEQENARHRLTVVLAMEEAEAGARAKGQKLQEAFAGRFARFLVTVHPANVPGEIAGKGPNQGWAARQAKRELVDRLKLPIENLVLTTCDADSILHLHYFSELTRLFAADERRYERFWQAPLLFDNNVWQVQFPIRLLTYFANAVQLSELANPVSLTLPLSTFSLSYKLANSVGYWDRSITADDAHMFLRCLFGTQGRASLVRIFLPTRGDTITGATVWQAMVNFYRQKVRHGWGCEDVGYVLQQWTRPSMPFYKKLPYLIKVLHDHLIFSIGSLAVIVGTLLAYKYEGTWLITLPPNFAYPLLLHVINVIGALGTWTIWLVERFRTARGWRHWGLLTLITEIVAWAAFPVLSVVLVGLPALQAQTQMMLGMPLNHFRTPKQAESPVGQ